MEVDRQTTMINISMMMFVHARGGGGIAQGHVIDCCTVY